MLVNQNGAVVALFELSLLRDDDVRYTYRVGSEFDFSLQTAYRYAGQRLDADTGLHFYNARFILADTIVPNPGDPQSPNTHRRIGGKAFFNAYGHSLTKVWRFFGGN